MIDKLVSQTMKDYAHSLLSAKGKYRNKLLLRAKDKKTHTWEQLNNSNHTKGDLTVWLSINNWTGL